MLEKGQKYTDGYCLYQIELIDNDTVKLVQVNKVVSSRCLTTLFGHVM